jgi:ubiquinone/menaquinone biosynthesis C-methylase UbiE
MIIKLLKGGFHFLRNQDYRNYFLAQRKEDLKALKSLFVNTKLDSIETDPKSIAEYYDEWTEKYQEFYGDVIQAYRPTDTNDLYDYLIEKIGLEDGMLVLDAGCGLADPLCYFAKIKKIKAHGVTISAVQFVKANAKIESAQLQKNVNVHKGDYHKLHEMFPNQQFDVVFFLESLSHSENPIIALESAFKVLKPGGKLFIKDYYEVKSQSLLDRIKTKAKIFSVKKYFLCTAYQKEWMASLLEKASFRIEKIETPPFLFDRSISLALEQKHGLDINQYGKIPAIELLEFTATKPTA